MINPAIAKTLLAGRQPYDAAPLAGEGVYAIFLKPRGQLLPITPGESGLLFIGATHTGLRACDEFALTNSGFSTLRRSLGAILRKHLWLQPCARAPGASEANVRNYAFIADSEAVLSRWMRANLMAATHPASGDLRALEAGLIAELSPPLNLAGWNNPQRPLIRRLRAECAGIARDLARAAA